MRVHYHAGREAVSTILPLVAFLACWGLGWRIAVLRQRAAIVPVCTPTPRMPRTTPECIDFTIVESSPAHSRIRWKNGRVELVTPTRLATLKKSFLWVADFAV